MLRRRRGSAPGRGAYFSSLAAGAFCCIFQSVKPRIRNFLSAIPFQPFIIRMADGHQYRVDHPDFVLAASSDIPQVTIEEPDGTQHYLSALLITSVERVGPISSAA